MSHAISKNLDSSLAIASENPWDLLPPHNGGVMPRLLRWPMAIREGFIALLPLTLLGAMASVLANVPINGYHDFMHQIMGASWSKTVSLTTSATLGIMGIASAMSISLRLSFLLGFSRGRNTFLQATIGAVAAAAYMLTVLSSAAQNLKALGYMHIFEGVLIGIASAELMHWSDRWIPRKQGLNTLEFGVPLQQALRISLQAVVSLFIICASYHTIRIAAIAAGEMISVEVSDLFIWSNPSPWLLNLVLTLSNQILWLFGINGGQFFLSLASSGAAYIAEPDLLYSASGASPSFSNTFAHLGGGGATWGLIIAIMLTCKDISLRRLAWISVLPAVINVNELLLFGIPLVFGRPLLLPFLLAPVLNCFLAQVILEIADLTLTAMSPVWSTPIFISGYLATGSWIGALIQGISLAACTLLYIPYVKRLEQSRQRKNKKTLQAALTVLTTPAFSAPSILDRSDNLGEIARALIDDFREDLSTNQIALAYQTQRDTRGKVVGVEALLRWRHGLHGAIPTAAIINISEECDVIHSIGEWVVNQACTDLARWRRMGLTDLVVSINMSPMQLEDPAWPNTIARALSRHNVPPNFLDVEITEGRAMSTSLQADQTLNTLQKMGLKLSMDDFGMGCTSLLYMQRFRMHSIKLDGRLTRNVLNSKVNQEIIRAVARLGASQGVLVVAEFVENIEQRDALEDLGCHLFQGYLYGKELPAKDLERLLIQISRP